MDRKTADSAASLAVDMTLEVFKTISATVAKTIGANSNRDLINHLVATAFVTVGAKLLRGMGEPKESVQKLALDAYEAGDGS